MKNKLEIIVDKVMKEINAATEIDEFMIGFEPVKEYVIFWLVVDGIQKHVTSESNNLIEIFEEINGVGSKIIAFSDDNYRKKYDRLVYQYHHLNRETIENFENTKKNESERRQKLKDQDSNGQQKAEYKYNGNAKRFEGQRVFKFQKNELNILLDIKNRKHEDVGAEKTYLRLVKRKSKLSTVSFKQYQDFVTLLKKEIDDRDDQADPYKDAAYYKLEKRLGFELMKAIARAFQILKDNGEKDEEVLRDLLFLNNLPLINDRQKYVSRYLKIEKADRRKWRIEVERLLMYIICVVNRVKAEIDTWPDKVTYSEELWAEIKDTYVDEKFKNDFKQKKDFSASTFKTMLAFGSRINNKEIEWTKDEDKFTSELYQLFFLDSLVEKSKGLHSDEKIEAGYLDVDDKTIKLPNGKLKRHDERNRQIENLKKEAIRLDVENKTKENVLAILDSWKD